MRQWEDQFCNDLLQRVLGVREAELLAEQRRLGGISIGGRECWEGEIGRVDEGLGLLNERLEHCEKKERERTRDFRDAIGML